MTPPAYARLLADTVATTAPRLLAMTPSESRARQRPNGWSRCEVIGHLIDSATINTQRFVRAQRQDDLVFPTYDQDFWVATQRYHDADWQALVQLWALHNTQLSRLMSVVPEELRCRVQSRHNFDRIAFRVASADEPSTLDFLMDDYCAHLTHHLVALFQPGWSD